MTHQEFKKYILEDLFAGIEGITSRRMFSGAGLYKHGVIFGMIVHDTLYFKVDETNKHLYQKQNSKPFSYSHYGKIITISYWEVPADVIDNKKTLHAWVEQAYMISKNRKAKQ